MLSTTKAMVTTALNALYLSVLICVSPLVIYRMIRHGRYRSGWREKILGLGTLGKSDASLATPTPTPDGFPTAWLHAVSVGEVQLLRTLIGALQDSHPDLNIVVSTSTDSGHELACKLYGSTCRITYAPLDFSWAIRNAWKRINPSVVLLAELEIWPNWLLYAQQKNCPVIIVNGRLSERSFRGYQRIQRLLAPVLQGISLVAAQNETYAQRFVALGVRPDAVTTTGSIKFDGAEPNRNADEVVVRRDWLHLPNPADANRTSSNEKLVWVAGSTQEPEEELVISAFSQLLHLAPSLKLILVPRHPERFEAVAQLLSKSELKWERRSNCIDRSPAPDWQVFLGDTVGELRWWWGMADVAFVGGSFGDRGGQNMIEPCAFGVATCFGPNTRNFRDIVQLLTQEQACVALRSPEDLEPWIRSMLQNPRERFALGERAKDVAAKHRGALQRTMAGIERFL